MRQVEVDLRYLRICWEYAQLSRCHSRKIGAMLVNPDGIVIGLGVNGPPRGIAHCEGPTCPRHREGEHQSILTCPAVHAEVNALLACGRTNNSTVGCSMYIWPIGPCKDCAAQIVQAGIRRLIFPESAWYDQLGPWILSQSPIEVVNYPRASVEALSLAP